MATAEEVVNLIAVNRDALAAMEARMREMEAQLASRVRYKTKFMTFNGEGKDVARDFDRWESQARIFIKVMNYTIPSVITALLGKLEGRAHDVTHGLLGKEDTF